jgi:hypothetical protein
LQGLFTLVLWNCNAGFSFGVLSNLASHLIQTLINTPNLLKLNIIKRMHIPLGILKASHFFNQWQLINDFLESQVLHTQ